MMILRHQDDWGSRERSLEATRHTRCMLPVIQNIPFHYYNRERDSLFTD